jgi:hypothetical protein
MMVRAQRYFRLSLTKACKKFESFDRRKNKNRIVKWKWRKNYKVHKFRTTIITSKEISDAQRFRYVMQDLRPKLFTCKK